VCPSVKGTQSHGKSETDSTEGESLRDSCTSVFKYFFVSLVLFVVTYLSVYLLFLFLTVFVRANKPDCSTLRRTELVESEWGRRQNRKTKKGHQG